MSIILLPVLLLGPGLIIASFFAKRMAVRVVTIVIGVMLIVWMTSAFAGLRMVYEHEHRTVENQLHRMIITAIDGMLANGHPDKAKGLTDRYLRQTKDSPFMRNSLGEIVQSIEKDRAEQSAGSNSTNRADAVRGPLQPEFLNRDE